MDTRDTVDTRETVLRAVEERIAIAERTRDLLRESFKGRDLDSSGLAGTKTLRSLLNEADEEVLKWHGAREHVLTLPWRPESLVQDVVVALEM